MHTSGTQQDTDSGYSPQTSIQPLTINTINIINTIKTKPIQNQNPMRNSFDYNKRVIAVDKTPEDKAEELAAAAAKKAAAAAKKAAMAAKKAAKAADSA